VSGRKGCFVGCAAVLGLVLLYPLWLLANIVIPLTLGFLFPWEPPLEEGAPDKAVLRVIAPEGEPYRIEWGTGFSRETVEGEEVDPELGYRDYPVHPKAVDKSGSYTIWVRAGDEERYRSGNDDIPLGALLFIDGKYADCEGVGVRLMLSGHVTAS
jgi:hypothetical protein